MIKIDMEMPSFCSECPFYSGYNGGICIAYQGEVWNGLCFGYTEMVIERHRLCPLQEVNGNDQTRK